MVSVAADKVVRQAARTGGGYEKRGGQVVMGPQQPRPKPQAHIPPAPPRGK